MIFDLDGVLVDAEIWWDEVRRSWAAARDRAWTPADLAAVMGANSLGWARIMRERLDLDLPDQEIVDEIVAAMVERYERLGAPLIEGADLVVRRLAAAGVPLGLASSAHRAVIDAALASLGIGGFLAAVVSSDDVAHGKPAPDVYLLAARRMGVEPASCLVVEDSLNGVLAGRAAGMTVALVPNASVPPAPGAREAASVVLDSLAELESLVELPAASHFLRYSGNTVHEENPVGSTGLAANPKEYRERLKEQEDAQLDAWAAELMRDIARRRGVLRVLADFKKAARVDDRALERIYAAGGGAPATFGHDAKGEPIVPAIMLWALVPGIRREAADGRDRIVEYLVENFEDLVYV